MAEIVTMPKMSDTMTEGTIAAWHKKVGDKVTTGELMAEIETDKATMEYESYSDGTVLYLGCKEGESVVINGVMAIVGAPGEDYSALLAGASAPAAAPQVEAAPAPVAAPAVASAPTIDISGIKAEIVSMPKMSDTMVSGTIAAWNKKVGDKVASGELLAEIETDKATMEYESYSAGVLLYIGANAGESVLINAPLAVIGEAGADFQKLLDHYNQTNSAPAAAPKAETVAASAPAVQAAAPVVAPKAQVATDAKKPGRLDKVSSSPLARKLAFERGFNLAAIAGTGPNGRVTKYDVDNYVPVASAPAASTSSSSSAISGVESFEEVKLNGMRKAIAKKVSDSKFSAPHFYITMDINMDNAITARTAMNASGDVKISFNDLVVKATALALKKHPKVNTHWLGDAIRYNHHVHVGVAISVGDALYIPKIDFTDTLSLSQISSKVRELAGKVKEGKVSTEEMTGGTFTISNLGMFGVDSFTAILNPPATCILAVGGISKVPVVKGDQIVPGNVMKVTLSCDHRAVDGAVGAAFLNDLKAYLEDPIRMLV
jgi:pyruvate dehydrogenase E2 component (dihydrolipoamide acetyltransferase)